MSPASRPSSRYDPSVGMCLRNFGPFLRRVGAGEPTGKCLFDRGEWSVKKVLPAATLTTNNDDLKSKK